MSYLQYIDYGDSTAPLQVVSFHGFPAVRSKQNRELAFGISRALNCRVRVVLYPGLSCPGVFSFKKTIHAMVDEFPQIVTESIQARPVDVLGHSFGGFCSILLASTYPALVRRMVLLSPLLKFASSEEQAKAFFVNVLSTSEGVTTLRPQELAAEFEELSREYRIDNLVARLNPKMPIKFMQARSDQTTPTSIAEDFRQHFTGNFTFELVDQDHSFLTDRPALSLEIAEFFR